MVKALNEQPVSVGINAGLVSFMFYSHGIYDPIPQDCNPATLDHGVLLVGYNSEHELPYFILKNSWGTSWGDKGYMLISIGKDHGTCGTASDWNVYPVF